MTEAGGMRGVDLDTVWAVAERARARSPLSPGDVSFVRNVGPIDLAPIRD